MDLFHIIILLTHSNEMAETRYIALYSEALVLFTYSLIMYFQINQLSLPF